MKGCHVWQLSAVPLRKERGAVVDPGLRVRVWGRVGGWVCVCREQRRPLLSQGSVLRERVARSFLTRY